MKFILSAGVFLMSLSVFAAAPSEETARVVRALVNNPEIVSQVKANGAPALTSVEIIEVRPSVYQYDLVFNRQCLCPPSTATVRIVEDITPTFRDGPIAYTSSISIK